MRESYRDSDCIPGLDKYYIEQPYHLRYRQCPATVHENSAGNQIAGKVR